MWSFYKAHTWLYVGVNVKYEDGKGLVRLVNEQARWTRVDTTWNICAGVSSACDVKANYWNQVFHISTLTRVPVKT